jgi:hypothetical protein
LTAAADDAIIRIMTDALRATLMTVAELGRRRTRVRSGHLGRQGRCVECRLPIGRHFDRQTNRKLTCAEAARQR